MDYTAIGTAVILASRLEQYATADAVFISDATHQFLGGYFHAVPVPDFMPKGFSEVQRVWQVLGRYPLLKFAVDFVAPDTSGLSSPDAVMIALGQHCGPGRIGRQPRSAVRMVASETTSMAHTADNASAAALVYAHPELVLQHVERDHLPKVRLILPRRPDFDAIVAAYLVQELLDKGNMPPAAQQIVEYAQRVQAGMLPSTPAVWHTPYGVLLGIRGRNLRYCQAHALSQTQQDLYDVQRTFYFLQYLVERITAGVDIIHPAARATSRLFDEAEPLQPPFERERDFVRRDVEMYDHDVTRARTFALVLPVMGTQGTMQRLTAIALEDPTSALFATWAHHDTRHTTHGFDLVILREHDTHYSLSLKPTAGVWLQGLGTALEHAEAAKRQRTSAEELSIIARVTPTQTQVWDDQCVPDYTRIETTRHGTALSMAEVLKIVQDATCWMP